MNDEAFLIIVRHGTARMPAAGEDDFTRNLTPEGIVGVQCVANWLAERIGTCSAIVTSPATRARQTAQILAGRLLQGTEATVEERIYNASHRTLTELVQSFNYPGPTVLVGHNPGLEELANYLLDAPPRPTVQLSPGQALCMRIVTGWAATGRGTASLEGQISPGEISKGGS